MFSSKLKERNLGSYGIELVLTNFLARHAPRSKYIATEFQVGNQMEFGLTYGQFIRTESGSM